jgi:hypothetical protein
LSLSSPARRASTRPAIFSRLRRDLRETFRLHVRRSEHDRISRSGIGRLPGDPVIVRCKSEHHRPNCRIVSLFGQRPHFFGSHAPVRRCPEKIVRVGNAFAPQIAFSISPGKPSIMRYSGAPPLKVDDAPPPRYARLAHSLLRGRGLSLQSRPTPATDARTSQIARVCRCRLDDVHLCILGT